MVIQGPILVCFAVREEAAFFSVPKCLREACHVVITGMGALNAVATLNQAYRQLMPRLILTCGFAGGLRPGLPLGSVLYSADPEIDIEPTIDKLGAIRARFHFSERIAWSAAEKASLWSATGADAVEMESEAIRRLAKTLSVPSATVRVISDPAEEDLPLDFNQLLTEDCRVNYRKLAWRLARAPGRIPALLRFQRQTRLAARRLGEVLQGLLAGNRVVH